MGTVISNPFPHAAHSNSYAALPPDLPAAVRGPRIGSIPTVPETALITAAVVSTPELAHLGVRHGAQVIASSYNGPRISSEWGRAVMRAGRDRGLVTAYISNGNATPEVLDYLRPVVDCYKVDLKAMRQHNYQKLGARLDTVLTTIANLRERDFWAEIVTLLVSAYNDSDEERRDRPRCLSAV